MVKLLLPAKVTSLLQRYLDARRDASLRAELTAFRTSRDDETESAAWRQVLRASDH